MSRRHFQSTWFLIAAGALFLAAPRVNGQSAPIPHSSTSTNTSGANSAMALQNLDEKFGTPFGSFKQPGHDDLFGDPLVVNVPQPLITSKARDLMDKSANWAFLTPADYNDQGTIEEAIGAPSADPNNNDKKTALDRFNEEGMRTGLPETKRTTTAARNSDQADDSDDTVSPVKLDKSKDSSDADEVDGGKDSTRTSKFDDTAPVFADPNSTWGFSEVFGRKESKEDKDRAAAEFRDSDAEKDIFARLQAGPSFSAVPDANTGVGDGGLNSFNSLQNPLDGGSPAGSSAIPDSPVVNTSADSAPGFPPAAGGSFPESQGSQDTAIAPVAPGAAPVTPSDSGQIDLSRYANPQPIYSPPKRQY